MMPKPGQSLSAMVRRCSNSSASQATGNHIVRPHVDEYGRRPSVPQQKLIDRGLSAGCWLSASMAGAGNPIGGISAEPVQNGSISRRLMSRTPSAIVHQQRI